MPIIIDDGGKLINGIGRLEYAARRGFESIEAVVISKNEAKLAKPFLNLLTMDFIFEGENPNRLRFASFRRDRMRRKRLGTAFVLPVSNLPNKQFDINNPEHSRKWKEICGLSVLDFGSGHGIEAEMLRKQGVKVTEFEPYLAVDGVPCIKAGRKSATNFLKELAKGTIFNSIFLSSVLNSVPFIEDRKHIIRICASLSGENSVLYASVRGVQALDWRRFRASDGLNTRHGTLKTFQLNYEPGISIGDLADVPKVQKYHTKQEAESLFSEFFHDVEVGLKSTAITVVCRRPKPVLSSDLIKSIAFEFDLPYPGGERLNMKQEAFKAFGQRLGLCLEDL